MGGKVNHSPNFPQRPKNPTCKSFSRLFRTFTTGILWSNLEGRRKTDPYTLDLFCPNSLDLFSNNSLRFYSQFREICSKQLLVQIWSLLPKNKRAGKNI